MSGHRSALVTWTAAALAVAMGVSAQVPQRPGPPTAGAALMLGQVVDAGSGQGVAGAVVTLSAAASAPAPVGELLEARPPAPPFSMTAPTGTRRALTAADGRFLFRDLPKGRFVIYASAPGYVPGGFGQGRPQGPTQTIDLDTDQKLGGITVRIWKYGSISGTILDEHGEPAVGINIRCLRKVISGGQKRWSTTGLSTLMATDDRGAYRIADLPPSDYICGTVSNQTTMPISVAVTSDAASQSRVMQDSGASLSDGRGIRVGNLALQPVGVGPSRGLMPPAPDANGRLLAYPTQYYPAASTTREAAVITVKAGEERGGVNLQLRLVPAVRVTGRVIGPDGPAPYLGITLVPSTGSDIVSEGQAEAASTVSDATGAFTFLGVPSGQYVLKIRLYTRPAPGTATPAAALDATSLWAMMPATVGETDLTDLAVVLRPGLRVTGRVEFAGARPQPGAADLLRIGIRLQSAEGRTSSPIPLDGRVAADGTFRTTGYPAGRYIASVLANTLPAGWSLKSITYNGKDISVDPVELTDTDIGGAVIAFTDRTTELSGTVTGPNGADPNAEVIVFPADSTAWKEVGIVARRGRNERVNKAGVFSISGLPPGDYYVAAIPIAAEGDRQDPAFLGVLVRGAVRVTLADGGKATVQLTVRAR